MNDVERYYRYHALVYDLTRWTFLFGRHELVGMAVRIARPDTIMEVGCGTGNTLAYLAGSCPEATLTGIDLSEHMLLRCRRRLSPELSRVNLIRGSYPCHLRYTCQPDLILFSYTLSMFNPGFDVAIRQAAKDLRPGGNIAVVDFHDSPFSSFRKWMSLNHVRMEGQLLAELQRNFTTVRLVIRNGYGGLWRYFLFIGQKAG